MTDTLTLTVDRTSEGAWRVSAIVGGYLITRRYIGYTRREAVAMFRREMADAR